jgi:hypothetical protein
MVAESDRRHVWSMQDQPRDLIPVRSAAFVMAALLGAFMAFLAINGALDPLRAAAGYGVPLAAPADAFYLLVKAGRDLAIAAAVFGLLRYRHAKPLAILVGTLMLAPICDMSLVMHAGRTGYALAVHGSAVAYGAVLVALLCRRQAR